jgi:hypothetical protein
MMSISHAFEHGKNAQTLQETLCSLSAFVEYRLSHNIYMSDTSWDLHIVHFQNYFSVLDFQKHFDSPRSWSRYTEVDIIQ